MSKGALWSRRWIHDMHDMLRAWFRSPGDNNKNVEKRKNALGSFKVTIIYAIICFNYLTVVSLIGVNNCRFLNNRPRWLLLRQTPIIAQNHLFRSFISFSTPLHTICMTVRFPPCANARQILAAIARHTSLLPSTCLPHGLDSSPSQIRVPLSPYLNPCYRQHTGA
jgi:hypothetical protein